MPEEELEGQLYTFKQSEEAITTWKAHQLRSVRQYQAGIDCLNLLDDVSVLIIQEWVIKFLPAIYRESQSDLFGKRGLS